MSTPPPREISLLGRALLGLLQQGESSGYDIRRLFTQTPMGTFGDSPGAIYPALARLEKEGLIQGRIERSAGLRRRRMFRLTTAGRTALEAWLAAPVTRDEVVRGTDILMLRFGFIETTLGEAEAVRFLQALRREVAGYLAELTQYVEATGGNMPRSGRLALDFGIRSYDALLQWSEQALTAYGKQQKQRKHQKGERERKR
jgi:DNA-binding PadR family transcriptional regulator